MSCVDRGIGGLLSTDTSDPDNIQAVLLAALLHSEDSSVHGHWEQSLEPRQSCSTHWLLLIHLTPLGSSF